MNFIYFLKLLTTHTLVKLSTDIKTRFAHFKGGLTWCNCHIVPALRYDLI